MLKEVRFLSLIHPSDVSLIFPDLPGASANSWLPLQDGSCSFLLLLLHTPLIKASVKGHIPFPFPDQEPAVTLGDR